MPRNGKLRDLFSCLFGAIPFSPAAISHYLPVYSCQARPLLIIMVSSFLMIVNVNVFHSCNIGHISLNALRTHPPGHDQFRLLIS